MHGGFNKARKELMTKSLVKQFGKDVLKEIEDVGVFGQVDVPLRKSVFRK